MENRGEDKVLLARKVGAGAVMTCVGQEYGWTINDVTLLPGGTENSAWLITQPSGRYVAKVFSVREGPIARIQEENELYKFLNLRGVHVPEVVSSLRGQNVSILEFEGVKLMLVVMKFEELRMCMPNTMTQGELTRIALAVAKMHKASLGYSKDKSDVKNKVFDVPEAFAALEKSIHARKFSKRELDWFKAVDARSEEYIRGHLQPEQLTKTLIHGDLAPEHTRFLPDGSVYFFDFSDRAWAPVALELGIYFVALHSWGDISFARWERLREGFLAGYESVIKLSENDKQAISLFMLYRQLDVIKYLCSLYKNEPNEHTVNWVRRGYALSDRLLRNL